jgi:tripartite-type tricarboxylate transporter receptor subunit TctC
MNRITSKRSLRRFPLFFLSLGGIFLSYSWAAAADEPYPARPVNIIVGYAPGGVVDTSAKIIGDRLAEVLGQSMLRVHKPGGGGVLAASFTSRAKPDGYNLYVTTSGTLILTPILKKVDYALEDFIPLSIYAKAVMRLYVRSDAPWKTLEDFAGEARRRPGQLKVSSAGRMTHMHFVLEAFSKRAGIVLAHVPYKSCAEAVTALLGGHVDADVCSASMGQAEAGMVRALGVADYERSKYFPEVKTFIEQGYPVALPGYYTLVAPAKTPPKILEVLDGGMQKVFEKYGKEIGEELVRVELFPTNFDSKRSIQEFKKEREIFRKLTTELGVKQE